MPINPTPSQPSAGVAGSDANRNDPSNNQNTSTRSECVVVLVASLAIVPISAAVFEIFRIGQVLTGHAFWSTGATSKLNRCKNFGIHLACLILTPLMPIVMALILLYGIIVSPTQAVRTASKVRDFYEAPHHFYEVPPPHSDKPGVIL